MVKVRVEAHIIEMSRVPCVGEWVRVDLKWQRVTKVFHANLAERPGDDVAAVLVVEPPADPAE